MILTMPSGSVRLRFKFGPQVTPTKPLLPTWDFVPATSKMKLAAKHDG